MDIAREAPASFRTSARRPGPLALVVEGIQETLSRQRLIRHLIRADLKRRGSNTLLGNIWWVLDPVLTMLVYFVMVSIIFQRSTPDYPLFLFAAILPWKWFASTVTDAAGAVVGQERLIKQIHFPKLVLPIANALSEVVNFFFGLIPLLLLVFLLYGHRASIYLLLIPVVAVVQFVMSLGVALVLSAVNVFYRDIGNIIRHVLRLLFYLSPALYSVDDIHRLAPHEPLAARVLLLNPFAVLFEAYRAIVYEGGPPHWSALGVLFIFSLVLLTAGIYFFKRLEPSFAKIL